VSETRGAEQGPVPFQFKLEDAARYIGMSPRWLEASDMPRVRVGRAVRFLREDLETYMRARRTHGAAA
jgi:excisionase family DNA binding protein